MLFFVYALYEELRILTAIKRANILQLPYGRTRITLFYPSLFLQHSLLSCIEVCPFLISRFFWKVTLSRPQTSIKDVRHFDCNINRMHFRLERSGNSILGIYSDDVLILQLPSKYKFNTMTTSSSFPWLSYVSQNRFQHIFNTQGKWSIIKIMIWKAIFHMFILTDATTKDSLCHFWNRSLIAWPWNFAFWKLVMSQANWPGYVKSPATNKFWSNYFSVQKQTIKWHLLFIQSS